MTANINTATLAKPAIEQSEIQRETEQLEKVIQLTFDSARALGERLQPILRQYPSPPQDEKEPEAALSDLGGNLRRSRKSIEGINGALTEILNRLAI
jgi:hypothetical protein